MNESNKIGDLQLPTFNSDDFAWPVADASIQRSVNEALANGQWGKYHGQYTDRLQSELQTLFQIEHSMLCSSGTIGVELAMRGVGVKPGDEVIIAGYDFPGNFRCIEALGATPVLVDIVAGGWVMDPQLVAAAVSSKTKAVIVSHLYGQIADIDAIRQAIDGAKGSALDGAKGSALGSSLGSGEGSEQNVLIIEDTCQAPGGGVDNDSQSNMPKRFLGTLGDVGVFSFGGSKLLSAGRGGAVVSHSASVIQRIKIFSERGNDAFPLSQLQAAALLPQLESLHFANCHRKEQAFLIASGLSKCENLHLPTASLLNNHVLPAFYKFPMMVAAQDRAAWLQLIESTGLPVGIGFTGFHLRSARRCRKIDNLPQSRIAAENTLLLHHPVLNKTIDFNNRLIECFQKAESFIAN